jgi:hypothetical protein
MRYIIRNERIRQLAMQELAVLPCDPPHAVSIERYHAKRTLDQNAFLHAVPLRIIAEHTGYSLDDIKDYLLGEAFGWEQYEIMGRQCSRPLKRSSDLTVKEFGWFLEWIEAWAADTLGLIVPRPDEAIT